MTTGSLDRRGFMVEVFWTALRLGLTSFGGPIAHLGYFERTYVRRLHWLTSAEYAGLMALCQTLPGPTSSQVGFLIGLRRAGLRGALAAWAGFTLPSALLMYGFATLVPEANTPVMQRVQHGLMLTAVAVVAQAVWSMARTLCPDWQRVTLAVSAGLILLSSSSPWMQILVMLLAAVGGWLLCRDIAPIDTGGAAVYPERRIAVTALVLCGVLLGGLAALALLGSTRAVGLRGSVLSGGRAGVRRWACGAATLASGTGPTGVGL
jgi:chromate transporter